MCFVENQKRRPEFSLAENLRPKRSQPGGQRIASPLQTIIHIIGPPCWKGIERLLQRR